MHTFGIDYVKDCALDVYMSTVNLQVQVGAVLPQQRAPAGFQQTAPSGPNGAIKVTLQVSLCFHLQYLSSSCRAVL